MLFFAFLLCFLSNHSMPLASSPPMIPLRLVGPEGLPGPVVMLPRLIKSDEAWAKELPSNVYQVLRAKGTEPAYCGNLLDNHQEGIYVCAGCGLPLFSSGAKFHSGTGWPSFFAPYAQENILRQRDTTHGMIRDEILCARCGGHLGHVFSDGPPPTGLRYCLNSAALIFQRKAEVIKK